MYKRCVFSTLTFILLIFSCSRTFAQIDSYDLRIDQIQNTSINHTTDTPTQTPPPTPSPSSTSYIYQTTTSIEFTVSPVFIDYGILTPTNPVVRSQTLSVRTTHARYAIFASEDHELTSVQAHATIPDTTCDDGKCSRTTATEWTNPLTYGFGFRCSLNLSSDCLSNPASLSAYQAFANQASRQPVAALSRGKSAKEAVTYKVNVAGTQTSGSYQNAVSLIAVPDY